MKKASIFIILFTALQSCNTITEKDLTVVEGIKLGSKGQSGFEKQMQEIGNPKVKFSLLDYWEIFTANNEPKVQFEGYITKVFQSTKYESETVNHSSPINPEFAGNTNILEGVDIPLCHSRISPKSQNLEIYQAVAQGYIDEVKSMLITKYGNPTDTVRTNTIVSYSMPYITDKGVLYVKPNDKEHPFIGFKWKTKAVDILLGLGRKSYSMYYNKQDKRYISTFRIDLIAPGKEDPIYEHCYEYSFVRYQMNSEAKEKLKTDEPKI